MSDNALTIASSGQDIPASHHNELVTAFLQDIVPRNASRTAEDLAGALGTSALRWLRAYVQTFHVGTASANLTISEPVAGEMHILRDVNQEKIILKQDALEFYVSNVLTFKMSNTVSEFYVGGVLKFRVNGTGIDWTVQANSTIPSSKLQEVPTNKIEDRGYVLTEFTTSFVGGSWTLANSHTVGAYVGRKIISTVSGVMDGGGGTQLDVQVRINNVVVKTWSNIASDGDLFFRVLPYIHTALFTGFHLVNIYFRDGRISTAVHEVKAV